LIRRADGVFRWDHQFFPAVVKPLHDREVAVWKVRLLIWRDDWRVD
jgi:hypothetical protein